MATNEEKHRIVIEAEELASRKLDILKRSFENLGGAPMLKLQKETKATERAIAQLSSTADKGHGIWSRFTQGIAVGTIAANAAMSAFRSIKDALFGTIQAAADAQKEWSIVTAGLERHGLATEANIKSTHTFAESMQNLTGVADEEWGRAIMTMVDRGASLSQAFRLVSASADLATSKNKDITRTLNEMANMVGERNFKELGKYNITINESKTLTGQLDEAIARLNLNFGGAATDAADSYSVRVAAMKQSFGDLQESIGAQILPILTELAKAAQLFFNEVNDVGFGAQFDAQGKMIVNSGGSIVEVLKTAQAHMHSWAEITVGSARLIGGAFQVVFGAIQTVASPLADFINLMVIGVQTMGSFFGAITSGDFVGAWEAMKEGATTQIDIITSSFGNMADEALDTKNQIAELGEAWALFTSGIAGVTAPNLAEQAATTVNQEAQAKVNETLDYLALIPAAIEESGMEIEDNVAMATAGMTEIASYASGSLGRTANFMRNMMGGAVDSIITSMVTGRQSLSDVFKGIAQDFMIYFIKEALKMVADMFVPGLGAILGKIFDTPANDRMAARQGHDFMAWFTRGALAEAQGGSEMAIGLTRSSNRMTSGGMAGGGGGGPIIMNITISGNVMTDQFLEKTIIPKLKRLATDGRSALQLRDEHRTGSRDVRIE